MLRDQKFSTILFVHFTYMLCLDAHRLQTQKKIFAHNSYLTPQNLLIQVLLQLAIFCLRFVCEIPLFSNIIISDSSTTVRLIQDLVRGWGGL